jgi:hypothetical protein
VINLGAGTVPTAQSGLASTVALLLEEQNDQPNTSKRLGGKRKTEQYKSMQAIESQKAAIIVPRMMGNGLRSDSTCAMYPFNRNQQWDTVH